MNLRPAVIAGVFLGFTLLGYSPAASAIAVNDLLPEPGAADVCEPFDDGDRLVCFNVWKGDPENAVAPSATACVYDDNLNKVFWWYGGLGKVGCLETYHWAWLGAPGACVGTGATGDPTACAGRDEGGTADDPRPVMHCLVWVAGSSFCFNE